MRYGGIFQVSSEDDILPFSEKKIRFFDVIWLANFCGLIEPVSAKGTPISSLWQEECPVFYTCKTLSFE